jgi:hypothetical protein
MEDCRRGRTKVRYADVGAYPPVQQFLLDEAFVSYLGNQDRKQPERRAGFHVREPVADDGARREIDGPVLGRPQEQGRAGLSAIALLLGGVRAIIEGVDRGPEAPKLLVESLVDPVKGLFREEAPAHAGLVRHADDEIAVLAKEPEGVANPTKQLGPVRIGQIVQVRHHRPIAVHEDRAMAGPESRARHDRVGVGELLTVLSRPRYS